MSEQQDSTRWPAVLQAGDSALLVAFGEVLSMEVNNAAHAFDHAVNEADWSGVTETTPGIRGVLVRYDALAVPAEEIRDRLQELLDDRDWLQEPPVAERRRWQLPACYGGDSGPDLEAVAEQLGMSVEQTIQEHSECKVRILMLGFAPGCAYLGSLPERWDLPRLDHVKPDVPAGSLSVAIRQTVLFATPIPTGWQTIARTPFLSFDKQQEPWFHLAAGDEITFKPVDEKHFRELSREAANGKTIAEPEPVS